jgi:hypothetical protein
MSEEKKVPRDEKGRLLPGSGALIGGKAPGPGKRSRGRPKREDQKFNKKFLEDVLMRLYGGTALGATMAIEKLLSELPESEQVKVHMRMLELGARIVPKELRMDSGVNVSLTVEGMRRGPCPQCGYREGQAIDVTEPEVLPAPEPKVLPEDTRAPRVHAPTHSPELEDMRQEEEYEKGQRELERQWNDEVRRLREESEAWPSWKRPLP